jgi:hypothetical protein
MADLQSDTLTKIMDRCISDIPPRTLEYFVTAYTPSSLEEVRGQSPRSLVNTLKSHHRLEEISELYAQTCQDVNQHQEMYDYFMEPIGKDVKLPTDAASILKVLEREHLFGKAVFMLLLHLGSMEAENTTYYAVPRHAH